MTARMNDPDPKAEAAQLAYLRVEAAARTRYPGAFVADGELVAEDGTEADRAALAFEHETEAAYDPYLDVWHGACTPQAGAAGEPDMQAGL